MMEQQSRSRLFLVLLVGLALISTGALAGIGVGRAPTAAAAIKASSGAAATPVHAGLQVRQRAPKAPKGRVVTLSQPAMRRIADKRGRFLVHCKLDHAANDDPIVFHGQPGKSHLHDFYGNVVTDSNTTAANLAASPTTSCDEPNDHSAYWAPRLIQDGVQVPSNGAVIMYYGTYAKRKMSGHRIKSVTLLPVTPIPNGFRLISGRTDRSVMWECFKQHDRITKAIVGGTVPTCGHDELLLASIRFPSCWDGRSLDSPDHQSHVTWENARTDCPRRAPFHIPMITVLVGYRPFVDLASQQLWISGGPRAALASGRADSLHADIFTSWSAARFNRLAGFCLNMHRQCDEIRAIS